MLDRERYFQSMYFHNTNLPFLPCLCLHLSPWDVSLLVLWPLMPRGTCKFPCWLFPNVPCGNKSWQDLLVWCPNQIILNIKALMGNFTFKHIEEDRIKIITNLPKTSSFRSHATSPHLYCLLCQYGVNDWPWFLAPESWLGLGS